MGQIDDGLVNARLRRVAEKMRPALDYAVRHGMSFVVRVETSLPDAQQHEALDMSKVQESASPMQKTLAKIVSREGMEQFIDGIVAETQKEKKE